MTDATHHLVLGFNAPEQITAGFGKLAGLPAVQIVDVEFIHSIKGMPSTVEASGVDPRLADFDAADARLLSQADLDAVADAIPVGSMAAVIVYAGGPLSAAKQQWTDDGATVVREGAGASLIS